MDVDSIEPGEDFVEVLNGTLAACRAIVIVIDPDWISVRDRNGFRRLENPRDFVRLEVENALRRGIHILPVLVDGASMPDSDELPMTMRSLATKQAVEISSTRFRYDSGRLIDALLAIIGLNAPPDGNSALADGTAPTSKGRGLSSAGAPPGLAQSYELTFPPIKASIDKVWSTLTDTSRYVGDMPHVIEVKPITGGAPRQGFRYVQVTKLFGITIKSNCEITAFNPPHRLGVTSTLQAVTFGSIPPDPSVRIQSDVMYNEYALVSYGGSTIVTCSAYLSASFTRLADRMVNKNLDRRWLKNVRKVAET